MAPTINVVNQSSYDVNLPALKATVTGYLHDIAHAWGEYVWHITDHLTKQGFRLVIMDELDVQGALGYHDLGQDGKPYAVIGAKVSVDNGISISSVVTHEIAEMVGDPCACEWVDDFNGTLWARELCDATESDVYDIDGVEVSNFLYPSYFNPFGSGPYDHLGLVQSPFEIRPGGYAIYMTEGAVGQTFGDEMPDWKKARKQDRQPNERAWARGVRP